MTDSRNRKPALDNPHDSMTVLRTIEDLFWAGTLPEHPVTLADEELQERLNAILSDIAATQKFALALAQGDLSLELSVKGRTAGCLKSLQSSLRHLSWQAGQIAAGDLSQQVSFMGEFSAAFNTMVRHLVDAGTQRDLREAELRSLNAALAAEVAERRKAEEARLLANRKISMLASVTRHDIRNQLLVLRSYIQISRNITSDPKLLEFIRREELAAEAIGSQIEFTKYYEDIGVNAPEWQDIRVLIHEACTQLSVPAAVTVDNVLPPVEIFADGLIGKVIYNLIENTLRHGEHFSRIRFSFHETETGAEIVYEDDGVGIAPEDKARLFEKGFGRNTGLGLFLSKEILTITGLAIREEGEPGKGVRFVIAIPAGEYRLGNTP